jgi:hypothetical protein
MVLIGESDRYGIAVIFRLQIYARSVVPIARSPRSKKMLELVDGSVLWPVTCYKHATYVGP